MKIFLGFDYFGIVLKENDKIYYLPAFDVISWYSDQSRSVRLIRAPDDNFMIEYTPEGINRLRPTQAEINEICLKYKSNLYKIDKQKSIKNKTNSD